GFTGRAVVRLLSEKYGQIACLVRSPQGAEMLRGYGVDLVWGDLNQPESIKTALTGRDVLINVASLGFGHTAAVVDACARAGVRRAVFISTTAIFTTLPAASKTIRIEAERIITAGPLDYTILRPTMIYGKPGDRNMIRLLHWLK
ncbi:MAG: NAD(P)H-binding protein, partial [Deltaproteobacteria bacterium]|nr:NAD(P)H-binding protein [Deltaproteobacteria bacterium]